MNVTSFDALTARVCSEFCEMPGLRLTAAEAQRLFGLGEFECRSVLTCLVERRILIRRPDGRYALPGGHEMSPGKRRRPLSLANIA